jgi:hypothetical protein
MVRTIDLLKFCGELMKRLSDCGVRIDDYKYVEMCEEYDKLLRDSHKKEYAIAVVTEKYGVSESTLRRVLKRLCGPVRY